MLLRAPALLSAVRRKPLLDNHRHRTFNQGKVQKERLRSTRRESDRSFWRSEPARSGCSHRHAVHTMELRDGLAVGI